MKIRNEKTRKEEADLLVSRRELRGKECTRRN
jgi:hypothetical protein